VISNISNPKRDIKQYEARKEAKTEALDKIMTRYRAQQTISEPSHNRVRQLHLLNQFTSKTFSCVNELDYSRHHQSTWTPMLDAADAMAAQIEKHRSTLVCLIIKQEWTEEENQQHTAALDSAERCLSYIDKWKNDLARYASMKADD
jgi:hypothetical protein